MLKGMSCQKDQACVALKIIIVLQSWKCCIKPDAKATSSSSPEFESLAMAANALLLNLVSISEFIKSIHAPEARSTALRPFNVHCCFSLSVSCLQEHPWYHTLVETPHSLKHWTVKHVAQNFQLEAVSIWAISLIISISRCDISLLPVAKDASESKKPKASFLRSIQRSVSYLIWVSQATGRVVDGCSKLLSKF